MLIRVKSELSEQEKLAIENVVARTRLEYEEKISQLLSSHNDKCEAIKEDVEDRIAVKVTSLKEELERMKAQADEVPRLKAELEGNEKKLKADIKRLQTSLDSTSSSNQKVITELQRQNAELRDDMRTAKGAFDDRIEHINCLEVEVRL